MRIAGIAIGAVELLIGLNVVMYLLQISAIVTSSEFGLDSSAVYLGEKLWCVITSMFLHASPTHIFFNMVALFFIGTYLEGLIGEKKFLGIYFVGGIVGGLFFAFLAGPNHIAIGASGAIFAVGATLAVLRPNLPVFIFPIPFPMPLYIAIFGAGVVLSFMPGTAWQAHIGGLLTGLVIGMLVKDSMKKKRTYAVNITYLK